MITLRAILEDNAPILRVAHDEDDGGWQFLDGNDVSADDARVIALEEATQIDPSVLELADLPVGWIATRSGPKAPWERRPRDQ